MTGKNIDSHRLRSIPDIADTLSISIKTVRRMIERGDLESHRIGRQIRVSQENVEKYIWQTRQYVAPKGSNDQ